MEHTHHTPLCSEENQLVLVMHHLIVSQELQTWLRTGSRKFITFVMKSKNEFRRSMIDFQEISKIHTHVSKYQRGDRVWVRNLPRDGNKLDPLWTGPCEIMDQIGNRGRYQVAIQDNIVDVHADRLKMYLPHVDGTKIVMNYYKPQRQVPEDDTYVVEKILAHRIRNGQKQWKVQWQGYDHDFDTWEPASSFVGHLQQDWMEYNHRNHIEVPLTAVSH